jgi:hypothetical protein
MEACRANTAPAAVVFAKPLSMGQMFKAPSFCGLWLCCTFGATADLMAIDISASAGREVIGLDSQYHLNFRVAICHAQWNRMPSTWTPLRTGLHRSMTIPSLLSITMASCMMLSVEKGSVTFKPLPQEHSDSLSGTGLPSFPPQPATFWRLGLYTEVRHCM